MARKKVEKKELTIEEKLEQEKQQGLSNIEIELPYINTPFSKRNSETEIIKQLLV